MSVLNELKFVAAKRSTSHSPIVTRRNKLLKKLFEQEAVVKAELEGTTYKPVKQKTVKNADGTSNTIEVAKRVKRWAYTGDDGKVYFVVFYGNKLIEFAKGKQAIEVGDVSGLLNAIAVIKAAVVAGELDTQIESVAGAVKTRIAK